MLMMRETFWYSMYTVLLGWIVWILSLNWSLCWIVCASINVFTGEITGIIVSYMVLYVNIQMQIVKISWTFTVTLFVIHPVAIKNFLKDLLPSAFSRMVSFIYLSNNSRVLKAIKLYSITKFVNIKSTNNYKVLWTFTTRWRY